MVNKFETEFYKVKGVFLHDETEPVITGYFYQDKHRRNYIISDDFKHYETNPYTLCKNIGVKIGDKYLYENDIVSYFEPMRDKKRYGFIDFDDFYKCYVVRTGIETRATRMLKDCSKIECTDRNIVLSNDDYDWFAEWEKTEFEKSKSYVIDNSYCPSCFKK